MCDSKVPGKVKRNMYKTMLRPAMLHGMEKVVAAKARRQSTSGRDEMLRWSLGLAELDRVRNDIIRKRMEVGGTNKSAEGSANDMAGTCAGER